LDVLSIDTPREDRSYGSKAFSELEELLYRKILS